ncbi:MAG: hypothetical protein MZW92_69435, partial [Comamonadaceae bacterium]|nr:hypothetical protein [Comamonadaceae bacterium]
MPTLAEAGVQGVDVYSWQGVAGAQGPAARGARKIQVLKKVVGVFVLTLAIRN